jgi:hypothetical protein
VALVFEHSCPHIYETVFSMMCIYLSCHTDIKNGLGNSSGFFGSCVQEVDVISVPVASEQQSENG